MKICPNKNCGKEHCKSGIYCSRSCANSRIFSEEANEKKRNASLTYYASLSSSDREKLTAKQHTPEIKERKRKAIEERINATPWEKLSAAKKKERVLKEQGGVCLHCKNNTWLGQPMVFETDHTDGDTSNNKKENYRVLCPNCHSLTPTWRKGFKNRFPDDETILKEYQNSKSMTEILKNLNLKWGSYVSIIKVLERNGIKI